LGFFDDDGGICFQDDILNTEITKNKLLYFYAYDVALHVCSAYKTIYHQIACECRVRSLNNVNIASSKKISWNECT
jgi:hypothetical protein